MVKANPTMNLDTVKTQWTETIKSINTPYVAKNGYGAATEDRLQRTIDLVKKALKLDAALDPRRRSIPRSAAETKRRCSGTVFVAAPASGTMIAADVARRPHPGSLEILRLDACGRRCVARGGAISSFVSLVGPSGCGKSTLLRMTAGLVEPSQGSVLVRDKAVTGPIRDVGMVFQSPVLLPWRSTLGNILFVAEMGGLRAAAHTGRALELMALAGPPRLRGELSA